jgi:hypothetical protein
MGDTVHLEGKISLSPLKSISQTQEHLCSGSYLTYTLNSHRKVAVASTQEDPGFDDCLKTNYVF